MNEIANEAVFDGADAGTIVLKLAGEFDVELQPKFVELLEQASHKDAEQLILDVSELTFIDSSGLGALVSAHKDLEARGGRLVIRSPQGIVRRVLDVTGLSSVITIE